MGYRYGDGEKEREWKDRGEIFMGLIIERTLGYLVREEMQRSKLKGKAWGSEKRLEEGKRNEWVRLCLGEMRQKSRRDESRSTWEEERRELL